MSELKDEVHAEKMGKAVKEKIKVVIRLHPDTKDTEVQVLKEGLQVGLGNKKRIYEYFDTIYSKEANNTATVDMYECIAENFIHPALSGYNTAVITYGYAAAGKSHSLV